MWLLCICDGRGTIVLRLRDRTADSIQSIHSQEHWLPLGDQARRDGVRHRWSTALARNSFKTLIKVIDMKLKDTVH